MKLYWGLALFYNVEAAELERISAGLNWDSPEDLDRRMWWH